MDHTGGNTFTVKPNAESKHRSDFYLFLCPSERRRVSNDGEKRGKEMSAEKRKEKTERKNEKTVKKIKMKNENKVGESARNSEEDGLKVTEQKGEF